VGSAGPAPVSLRPLTPLNFLELVDCSLALLLAAKPEVLRKSLIFGLGIVIRGLA
jgi:hypothetical protein